MSIADLKDYMRQLGQNARRASRQLAGASTAEKNQVELHLDQPYAGNDNQKQKVDLYLPKKRNTDKPLPVVALIHGIVALIRTRAVHGRSGVLVSLLLSFAVLTGLAIYHLGKDTIDRRIAQQRKAFARYERGPGIAAVRAGDRFRWCVLQMLHPSYAIRPPIASSASRRDGTGKSSGRRPG